MLWGHDAPSLGLPPSPAARPGPEAPEQSPPGPREPAFWAGVGVGGAEGVGGQVLVWREICGV